MTIQLPVLIWTIIDFVLAMLILNTFLFKPYHAVMKKRAERANAQSSLYEENVQKAEQLRLKTAEDAKAAEEEGLIRYKKAVAEAEKKAAEAVAEAAKLQEDELKLTEKALEEEKKDMLSNIEAELSELSIKLADRLSA